MERTLNPFDRATGSERLKSPRYIFLLFFLVLLSAFITSKAGLAGGLGLIFMPAIFTYLYLLFEKPVLGLYTAIILGFQIGRAHV